MPPLNHSDWIDYFNLYKEIPEYKLQNYSMTLGEFKIIFWWEWIHRFLGRLIGICFLIPLIYFTFKLNFKKLKNLYLIFFLICFQGFIGWYMVSSGLIDRVDVSHYRLSLHLVTAFIILNLIFWNYLSLNFNQVSSKKLKISFYFYNAYLYSNNYRSFCIGMNAGKIYNS